MNNTIEQLYHQKCKEGSDINEHLPTLYRFGRLVNHITEFGVRTGNSTIAFLASRPQKMISYDVLYQPEIKEILDVARDEKIDFTYLLQDDLKIEIEKTDLLFIDTNHDYEQLKKELELHAAKVKKYLIFHDVSKHGVIGSSGGRGLLYAIHEFLNIHSNWLPIEYYDNNNGLLILGNKDNIIIEKEIDLPKL